VESDFEEREQYEANILQETLVVLEWYVADLWSWEEVLHTLLKDQDDFKYETLFV
jgi:hypothetical protein